MLRVVHRGLGPLVRVLTMVLLGLGLSETARAEPSDLFATRAPFFLFHGINILYLYIESPSPTKLIFSLSFLLTYLYDQL